jgi:hypothetical protein
MTPTQTQLTISQAARRIGCSITWVRVLHSQGKLPAQRTPLGLLLDAAGIDTYLAERKQARGEQTRRAA